MNNKRIACGTAAERAEDLEFLADLSKEGAFKPVIGMRYPFDYIPSAHSYVDADHKNGNVVHGVGAQREFLIFAFNSKTACRFWS